MISKGIFKKRYLMYIFALLFMALSTSLPLLTEVENLVLAGGTTEIMLWSLSVLVDSVLMFILVIFMLEFFIVGKLKLMNKELNHVMTSVNYDPSFTYLNLGIEEMQDLGTNIETIYTYMKKCSEEAKRLTAEYSSLVQDMPAVICRFLADGEILFINDSYCKIFSKEGHSGFNLFEFVQKEDLSLFKSKLYNINPEKPVAVSIIKLFLPEEPHRLLHAKWVIRGIFDNHDRLMEYQGIAIDITKEVELEAQLTQQEEYVNIG